jgi:phosphate transport system substrate-binding protein
LVLKKLIFMVGLVGLFLAAAVSFASVEGTINIAGSTSMQPLVEELAQAFMAENPEVKIAVQGGGSGVGVASVLSGTVDIGLCSRDLKPEEEAGLYQTVIAKDGIALIVNKSNAVSDLSVAQLQKIYIGEYTNWQDVGGSNARIIVVNRKEGSGTRSAFEEIILGELTNTGNCLVEATNDAVLQTVAITNEAIGYISLGSLDPEAVKALSIDNISCTKEQIPVGNYQVQRPFLMLTKTVPTGVTQAFIDWIFSEAGQKIVAKEYVSVI